MEEMKIKCGEKEGGREEKIERKEIGDARCFSHDAPLTPHETSLFLQPVSWLSAA